MTAVAAPLLMLAQLTGLHHMQYFPGNYFDTHARAMLHRQVLDQWPGPSGLHELWKAESLNGEEQALLLVGGAAFHNRQLLPAYAQAMRSTSPRVRQAAAYGYRYLVGDAPVDVTGGVDNATATGLREEMLLMSETLRWKPLVQIWLDALLAAEGKTAAGVRGLILRRTRWQCALALSRLTVPEDLELLVNAYQNSDESANQILLLRFIQSLAMRKFLTRPKGTQAGWGPYIYDNARQRLAGWLGRRCTVDFEEELRASFRALGVRGIEPMAAEACGVWELILLKGEPEWWSLAARRLYDCGGPGVPVSMLERDAKRIREQREEILSWYSLR